MADGASLAKLLAYVMKGTSTQTGKALGLTDIRRGCGHREAYRDRAESEGRSLR